MTPQHVPIPTRLVLHAVKQERVRQENKCAEKRAEGLEWLTCASPLMEDEQKLAVLMEEVGEVARELCDARAERRAPARNIRTELIQVAAICVAWVEALDTEYASEADAVEAA